MVKKELQAIMCQLSTIIDCLIHLVQSIEDICIDLGDEG